MERRRGIDYLTFIFMNQQRLLLVFQKQQTELAPVLFYAVCHTHLNHSTLADTTPTPTTQTTRMPGKTKTQSTDPLAHRCGCVGNI